MSNKVSFKFDPWELAGVEKPKDKRKIREAQEEISDYLLSEALGYIGESKSPVAGGEYKSTLSKDYKKIKEEISGSSKANLELNGDMLDALEVKKLSNGNLEYGVFKKSEALKADGHNHSGVFGDSKLPKREFIPKEGETFKRQIISGMREILSEFEDDNGKD